MLLTYNNILKLSGDVAQTLRVDERTRVLNAQSFRIPLAAAGSAQFTGWGGIDIHDIALVVLEAHLPDALGAIEQQPLLRGGPSAGVGNGDPIRMSPGVAASASGTLTSTLAANFANDDTFTLNDGVNPQVVFFFNVDGGAASVPSATLIEIDIQGLVTADEVRDAIIAAITGAATLDITPSIGGAAAVGTITSTAKADLVNDDTFTLDDGVNTPVVFFFNVDGGAASVPSATLIEIDIQAQTTADEVRAAIIAAITGAATLDITPSIGGAAATGTITAVAKSLLLQDETVVISDGANPAVTFFFDLGTSAQTQTTVLRKVDLSSVDLVTAGEVAEALAIAINEAPTLTVTALLNGADVELTNDARGTTGNVTITDTVVNAGFIVAGMSGGTSVIALVNDTAGTTGNVAIADSGGIGGAFAHAGMVDGTSVIALVNDTAGTAGNVTIASTVGSEAFSVSGMSGGVANAALAYTFRDRSFWHRMQVGALLNSPYILSGGDEAATPTTHPPLRLLRPVTLTNPNAFAVDVHLRVLTYSHTDQALLP